MLLDIWMPDTDGVTLLKEWSSTGLLNMPVIMMSGHATIDTAVEATKIGALAFGKTHHSAKTAQGGRARSGTQRCASACQRGAHQARGHGRETVSMSAVATVTSVDGNGLQATQNFVLDRLLREAVTNSKSLL